VTAEGGSGGLEARIVMEQGDTLDHPHSDTPSLVAGAQARLLAEGTREEAHRAAETALRPTLLRCGADGVWRAWQLLPSKGSRRAEA
jgi:hypothetical protein